MRTLNLQKLFHAVIVSEECSLVAASKKLFITQSALTRSIQSLETDLGIKIFNRIPSGVELTGEGKMVIERGREILDQTHRLYRDTLTLSSGSRSMVSFGVDPILTEVLLPTLLETIVTDSNLMQIQVKAESRSTLMTLLQDEMIDFFVTDISDFKPIDIKEVTIEKLLTLRGSMYARKGHPLENAEQIDSASLFQYPVITPSNVHERKWDPFDWTNVHPAKDDRRQQIICPDTNSLRHIVYNTNAVWASLDATVRSDIEQGKLIRLDYCAKEQNDMRNIGLLTLQKNTLSVHSQRLIEQLKGILAEQV